MEMAMVLGGNTAASTQQQQQLERMGRELKCPICLSLFKQAASLSCNHCFCMSCILTSMKSTSSCPICKVPAARREVRAAPQMDSLVAIYRGMESAVGVTMFATQQTQETNDADNNQDNAKMLSRGGKRGRPAKRPSSLMAFDKLDAAQAKRKIKPAALADITNAKQSLKRIPSKKRVQAPQFETEEVMVQDAGHFGNMSASGSKPTISREDVKDTMIQKSRKRRQRTLADEDKEANVLSLNDFNDFGTEHGGAKHWDFRQCGALVQHSGALNLIQEDNDSHAQNLDEKNRTSEQDLALQKGERNGALAPFFWLRDSPSQEEDCTQMKQTQTTQAQPVVVPAFSDLKDSEDILQDGQDMDEVTKRGGTDDGDAFSWTQHPCSPELHCTPSKEPRNWVVEDTLPEDLSLCITLFQEDAKHNDNVDQQGNNKNNGKDCDLQSIKSGNDMDAPEDFAGARGGGNHEKLAEHHISLLENGDLVSSGDGSEDPTRAVESIAKRDTESVISRSVGQPPAESKEAVCAFCQLSGDSAISGQLMLYKDGVLVPKLRETSRNAVAVHKLCAEWAPDVYFTENEDEVRNLEAEVARGQKLKCSSCGSKGAALGCCLQRCRKSFHYPCARASNCKWHMEKFIMLCPDHADYDFPVRKRSSRKTSKSSARSSPLLQRIDPNHMSVGDKGEVTRPAFKKDAHAAAEQKWPSGPSYKWVICGSALDAHGKEQLAKFASITGATLETSWNQKITHVVTGTDDGGAARRTMKFLMGILEGKWILKADWMAACLSAGRAVKETGFEICSDIHGMLQGPKRGRRLAASEGTKLFEGLSFFFTAQFEGTLKADLQALVQTGGGIVLHRKPIPTSSSSKEGSGALSRGDSVLIIYYDDASAGKLDQRKQEAMSVAKSAGAVALGHTWLLDSAAGCKLQPVSN